MQRADSHDTCKRNIRAAHWIILHPLLRLLGFWLLFVSSLSLLLLFVIGGLCTPAVNVRVLVLVQLSVGQRRVTGGFGGWLKSAVNLTLCSLQLSFDLKPLVRLWKQRMEDFSFLCDCCMCSSQPRCLKSDEYFCSFNQSEARCFRRCAVHSTKPSDRLICAVRIKDLETKHSFPSLLGSGTVIIYHHLHLNDWFKGRFTALLLFVL